MTSKERAKLRSKAAGEEAIFQIGKENIGDNLIKGLGEALDKRELIKISVLKGAADSPLALSRELSDKLSAQTVCVVGNKIVLYRYNPQAERHIEL